MARLIVVGCLLLFQLTIFPLFVAGSYKIVVPLFFAAKSHYYVLEPLLFELAKRGHEVVEYSAFVRPTLPKNFRHIDTSHCFQLPLEKLTVSYLMSISGTYKTLTSLFELLPNYETVSRCSPITDLLHSKPTDFDLVITETFSSEIALLVAYQLKLPIIDVHSTSVFFWRTTNVGNPHNTAYVPLILEALVSKMNFQERLRNSYAILLAHLLYDQLSTKVTDQVAKHLLGDSVPSVREMSKNISLILWHSLLTADSIRPLVPAVVDVGGIAVQPAKKIPADIEKFINGSEHGVIYFCMGSLLRGSSFPEDKRKAFLYAFSKIPQRVLWKWEGDNLPGKPDNVMIAKWMPQRDILAHPNVKLFISHGGLLGTNEAVYEGVPILGIPIFGDQRTNVKSIEASGAGELLDYNDISDEVVFGKIQKLLHDPKYRENAKELSRRYRDRPMSPLDTAVYWTEYVIRHKGAHHLRSAAVDLPWYQYLLLDVIAFVLLVLVVSLLSVYYSIKFTLRFIFRKLFGKKQPTKSEKSKKKLN